MLFHQKIRNYSSSQLKKYFARQGLTTTDDVNVAIYLLGDGTLISDEELKGQGRTIDHNIIQSLYENLNPYKINNYWNKILKINSLVMIIPEVKYAVIADGQELTFEQLQVISRNHLKIKV